MNAIHKGVVFLSNEGCFTVTRFDFKTKTMRVDFKFKELGVDYKHEELGAMKMGLPVRASFILGTDLVLRAC